MRQPHAVTAVPSAWTSQWTQGNSFRLLEDGREFFPRMLAAIEAARSFVLLEMYLVQSGVVTGRFIEAFVRARARGVEVYFLVDAFGALRLAWGDRQRLVAAGVHLADYNTLGWRKRLANLLRDHRKLLVVDDEVAFVGGAGLTDAFDDEASPDAWHDLMVEIRGPVVQDWQRLFAGTFRRRVARPAPPVSAREPRAAGEGVGRLVASAGWQRSALAASVLERVGAARRRVWIMSAYFVTSHRLRKALRVAVRRGVDVRLLGPGPKTDHPLVRHAARRFFGKLLRNGVRIFEYQPRFVHAKLILCDDWVSVGSSNLDRWSFKWNLEANQEALDPRLAEEAAQLFMRDEALSNELQARQWRYRALTDRLKESFAGALDRWLERWRRPSA
ncbi:MAG TPA: phosphatidylserine/phosphatidylglycerophosphate/cardiolipin synthase family protein [Steroidobacteraceae bacterium]|nr:phosphatidylserine/phosphatidylglycerophosphate/cardiolipin synthase family protein [Steroidobacteraceae bacterium]